MKTASALACDLLKELQVNSSVRLRKETLIGLVYTEYRHGKDLTAQLEQLNFEKFQTTVYTARAGSLHTFDPESRNHVFGLYGILQHANMNEPKLIELIKKEPERRSWHLGALAWFYPLADVALHKTEGSLRALCK